MRSSLRDVAAIGWSKSEMWVVLLRSQRALVFNGHILHNVAHLPVVHNNDGLGQLFNGISLLFVNFRTRTPRTRTRTMMQQAQAQQAQPAGAGWGLNIPPMVATQCTQIFIGDLGFEVTDVMLCQAFGFYPSLAGARVVRDPSTQQSKVS